MGKRAGPVVIEKDPQPGETWVHEDGTQVVVAALGYHHSVRQENGEYEDVFDPEQIAWWKIENNRGTYYTHRDEFLAEFKYVPTAQADRDKELNQITSELNLITEDTRLLEGELKKIGGGSTSSTEESTSTAIALTTSGGVQIADQMKKEVAKIRNRVQRNALRIKAETEKMAALVRMNVMAVKAKMEGIQAAAQAEATKLAKMVKAAEEVVWTFNLYLGKEETIVMLRDGKPAEKNEKIAIRQLALYMDEESALFADKGGIDFNTMEEFDNWVLESDEHINQVLPNTRGIVAIKPRRKPKEYTGDPRIDAILNIMNSHTYFLIRNGERVFRIDTDLEVHDTLLPRTDEFVKLFEKTVEKWGRRGRSTNTKETIRPGDEDYMRAMERADAKQRHYMRVFLFMQGLLDRTTVFHPFDVPRVNVFDMMRQDEHLQFVLDAETGRMLGDGRPSFNDWRDGINARIEVGMRVIGFFRTGDGSGRERESRTSPRHMNAPSSEELHTVISAHESRYGGQSYFFRYARTEPVYHRDWRRDDDEPRRRISIFFRSDDDEWIAFDLATVEEMEYYLRSRQNRHQYEKMFPILKKAIQLKKEEERIERPFRTALVGALMRDHGLSEEAATKEVTELVHWWKYKNKTHRALLSDDQKASRMILGEYTLRQKKAKIRTGRQNKHLEIADLLFKFVPDALAIYHKSYNLFIVYRPENESNVYTTEQLWRVPLRALGIGPTMTSEKHWVVPETRRLTRLALLEHRERWNTWQFNADPRKHLTDEEATRVFEEGMAKLRTAFDPAVRAKGGGEQWHDPRGGVPVLVSIATYVMDDGWDHWFWSRKSKIPKVKKLTGEWGKPVLMKASIRWKRNAAGEAKVDIHYSDESFRRSPFIDPEEYDDFFGERKYPDPIWFDENALKDFMLDQQAYKMAEAELTPMREKLTALGKQVKAAMKDVIAVEVRRKFDENYGEPDLWEAHLETFKFPSFRPESFERALVYLVERNIEVVGLSVGSIYAEAKTLGFSGRMEPDQWNREKGAIYLPPMDYVIKQLPREDAEFEPGEEDDDED